MQQQQNHAEEDVYCSTSPTWKKVVCLHAAVARLSIREKRRVFSLMRTHHPHCCSDSLLTQQGYTIGDFAVLHLLEGTRSTTSSSSAASSKT